MGAPKEVWVNVSEDGHAQWVSLTREGATPTSGREPHRYVLARPKREAVAWVVKRPDGRYWMGGEVGPDVWTYNLALARRYETRSDAADAIDPTWRIVKLVRPVKP